MHTLTITGAQNTDIVATLRESGDTYVIDKAVVRGIINAIGQGRDIEDALAPIQAIEAILLEGLGIVDASWPMPDNLPLYLADCLEEYEVTPLQAALSKLATFGEAETTVRI